MSYTITNVNGIVREPAINSMKDSRRLVERLDIAASCGSSLEHIHIKGPFMPEIVHIRT